MAYIPPLNGGRINATISGNTAGAGSLVSSGTLTLAGGNNITLSQAGNAITISGAAGGGGTLGFYGLGNTTQNSSTSLDARSVSLNGLGAMSVGYSNGSVQLSAPIASSVSATGAFSIFNNGSTVSMGVPAVSFGMSNIGNTSGTSGTASNQLVLAGGNNVTLSQATGAGGNTITISAGNGGGGGGIGLAGFGTTYSSGNITLSANGALTLSGSTNSVLSLSVPATSSLAATGAVSLSASGSTITIGAPVASSLSATGIVNISSNSNTISIGAPAYSAGISNGVGNTSGTTGFATNQLVLAGGNNITLSQATGAGGNTLSIVGGGGGGGSNTFGISNIGVNDTGTTGVISGGNLQMVFAGGDNITLSQSITGSSATITVSAWQNLDNLHAVQLHGNTLGDAAYLDHHYVQLYVSDNLTISAGVDNGVAPYYLGYASLTILGPTTHQLRIGGNTTGTSAVLSSGTVTLAGGNNITLSQAGNAITISGGGGGGGGGIGLAGFGTTYTSGNITLSANGALTLSGNTNSVLSLSVPATSSLSGTGAISMVTTGSTISIGAPAFSAGIATNSTVSNQLVLTGGNNITLSQSTDASGATISINGGAGGGGGATLSYFNPQDAYVQVTGQQGQATLHIQPMQAPNVVYDRIAVPLLFTASTSTSASITMSNWVGIYTRTASSLSLLTSYSTSVAATHSGAANSTANFGIRLLTISNGGDSLSEGQYWVGNISRTTSAGINNVTLSQLLASQQNSNFSGLWGIGSNATNQYTRGLGHYSATTTALPATIAFSEIRGTASVALRQPLFYFVSGTF